MSAILSDINFTSAYRYERIALKGSQTFVVSASSFPTETIAHNLGYVPYVKLYYSFGDGKYFPMFAGPSSYDIDGNLFQIDNVYVDTANITLDLENDNSSSVSITVYYRIYAENQS